MEEIRDNNTPKAEDNALTEEKKIKAKYSGEKVYKIAMTLHPDDETEVPVRYFFKRHKRQQLHAANDIRIANITPILKKVVWRGLLRIKPDSTLFSLTHLFTFRGG